MNIDLKDIWFQEDGAPLHFTNDTIDLLIKQFLGGIISRNADFNLKYS